MTPALREADQDLLRKLLLGQLRSSVGNRLFCAVVVVEGREGRVAGRFTEGASSRLRAAGAGAGASTGADCAAAG